VPKITLRVGSMAIQMPQRCRGFTTGAHSAGVLARVPIENVADKRCRIWWQFGFIFGGDCISFGNWAANLVAAGRDAKCAAFILEDAATYLRQDWSLEMGADTKEVLVPPGASELAADVQANGWRPLGEMKCLGQIVTANGSIEPDYAYTKQQLWKAYWANMWDPWVRTASLGMKLALMKRCMTPSLSYRCPRWPYRCSTAQRLDRLQAEMVARCLRLPPQPLESSDAYFRRARQQAALHCASCKWSDV